jgi:transcriptional regulator with XRE-family HTH domain
MNAYQTALKHFLDRDGIKQADIALKIGKSQPAVHRYATGERFPDAKTARAIDDATGGVVPFALWQSVAMNKLGIAA